MPIKWLKFGDFDISDDAIVYEGKIIEVEVKGTTQEQSQLESPTQEQQAGVGWIVSDRKCYGGRISLDVRFDHQVTNGSAFPNIVEIAFFEPSAMDHMLVAGIGGNFAMFAVREWDNRPTLDSKNRGWKPAHLKGGWSGNIKAGQSHRLTVQVEASRIDVFIDDINLGGAFVSFPIVNSQIGIFCQSAERVTISNFRIDQYKPMVFIAMPFSDPYNDLYSHVFEPVCERCELTPYRSDKTFETGVILAEIIQRMLKAHVVIAEITPNPANPNVYYEVGFAHALMKQVILVADRHCPNKLPFDVSPFRVLFYEDKIAGKDQISKDLVSYLRNALPEYAPVVQEYERIFGSTRIR